MFSRGLSSKSNTWTCIEVPCCFSTQVNTVNSEFKTDKRKINQNFLNINQWKAIKKKLKIKWYKRFLEIRSLLEEKNYIWWEKKNIWNYYNASFKKNKKCFLISQLNLWIANSTITRLQMCVMCMLLKAQKPKIGLVSQNELL